MARKTCPTCGGSHRISGCVCPDCDADGKVDETKLCDRCHGTKLFVPSGGTSPHNCDWCKSHPGFK